MKRICCRFACKISRCANGTWFHVTRRSCPWSMQMSKTAAWHEIKINSRIWHLIWKFLPCWGDHGVELSKVDTSFGITYQDPRSSISKKTHENESHFGSSILSIHLDSLHRGGWCHSYSIPYQHSKLRGHDVHSKRTNVLSDIRHVRYRDSDFKQLFRF